MTDGTSQTRTETPEFFGDDDLGRIQGILFGAHAKKVDERLAALEEALLGAISDLRNDLNEEIVAVKKQVAAEETTRSKAMKNLGERVDTEAEIRGETERELVGKIDSTESSIHASMEAMRSSMTSDSDQALAQIRDDKTDRASLADMLSAVADQLRGEE